MRKALGKRLTKKISPNGFDQTREKSITPVSRFLGELVIMNTEYPSIEINQNQWQNFLELENISYCILDNVEDQEIINWIKSQREWQVLAHSRNTTLFQRKSISLVTPEV